MKLLGLVVAGVLFFFPPEGTAAAIAILLFTFTGKSSA
jgi:hypothetical protein